MGRKARQQRCPQGPAAQLSSACQPEVLGQPAVEGHQPEPVEQQAQAQRHADVQPGPCIGPQAPGDRPGAGSGPARRDRVGPGHHPPPRADSARSQAAEG
jgi:hypothetical protein